MTETTNETDRQKFVRLATRRVNLVIHQLDLIGNLSRKSNYKFTDKDVKKIFKTLRIELSECEKRFAQNKPINFVME